MRILFPNYQTVSKGRISFSVTKTRYQISIQVYTSIAQAHKDKILTTEIVKRTVISTASREMIITLSLNQET